MGDGTGTVRVDGGFGAGGGWGLFVGGFAAIGAIAGGTVGAGGVVGGDDATRAGPAGGDEYGLATGCWTGPAALIAEFGLIVGRVVGAPPGSLTGFPLARLDGWPELAPLPGAAYGFATAF